MAKLHFKIIGLDCAEEIDIIKRELSTVVNEQQLGFDLMNGKLTIQDVPTDITAQYIIHRILKTGMHAELWDDYIQHQQPTTWWFDYGRVSMLVLSLLFIASGLIWHANHSNWLIALTGGYHITAPYPFFTKICYGAAVILGLWFVFPKAFYAVQRLRADMNLLMVIAVIGALIIQQWFEAASITVLFSLALFLESWSIGHARHSIKRLLNLVPAVARCYAPTTGKIDSIPVQEITLDSLIIVRPLEKIPLDGIITKGASHINQAPITGESLPAYKTVNDTVFAGTINGDHSIEFRVTKTASHTTLAQIMELIETAQHRKATSEQWVERFAKYYTPVMIVLALLIAIVPPLFFQQFWSNAFYQALVILVIACPCALVISTPISIVAGLSRAARAGILIKGGRFLEVAGQLKAIAFDKTATLTKGDTLVKYILPTNDYKNQDLLAIAASLEVHSSHPIAKAILQKAHDETVDFDVAEQFKLIPGKGATGVINGKNYWIGSHRMLHETMPAVESEYLHHSALKLEQQGHSIVVVGNDRQLCGLISVSDEIRPECRNTINQLYQLGIHHIIMLTGDNQGTAEAIAAESNIGEFHAELLPADKVNLIVDLVNRYQHVAMVGDGINDAPALASATLGIAMGVVGSDIAIETADIALMSEDLTKLPWLIKHSRFVLRTIKENITFALLLKAIFIVLAITGYATLWMAITADMGASLLVIMNSLRLLRHA